MTKCSECKIIIMEIGVVANENAGLEFSAPGVVPRLFMSNYAIRELLDKAYKCGIIEQFRHRQNYPTETKRKRKTNAK